MGPLEAFLCSRGLKTLELRVLAQSATTLRLAEWLAGHPAVKTVHYPWLEGHPGHVVARRQMAAGGTVLSFELAGPLAAARRVVESTRLFQLAVSLGAVESLIEIPALMSHGSYAPEARQAVGIGDGLIRLAVGLEAFEDLQDDLGHALSQA